MSVPGLLENNGYLPRCTKKNANMDSSGYNRVHKECLVSIGLDRMRSAPPSYTSLTYNVGGKANARKKEY